jgi:PelA/Pel-15E family pectate lyase
MRISARVLILICLLVAGNTALAEQPLRRRAAEGLKKAVDFFQNDVSCEGGYLWRYSEDLQSREGEGKASATTVWVQPPGTPAVGMALIEAYKSTGDRHYLEAARRTGMCLVHGQLQSGGWDYRIEFDPSARQRYAYRTEPSQEGKSLRNTTTLDDDTTQAALRMLMRLDQALEFKDERIHDAITYGLAKLIGAQYPNGAWPQRFDGPPDPKQFPVKRASYPDTWSRTYPGVDYKGFYTFNDNAMNDVIDVMFEAWHIYGDSAYRASAERAGGFLLLAQMPAPQPGWAQQYNTEMQPAWARKFEPPSITGGEAYGVVRALFQMYRETGDRKYLDPIPPAIAYYRSSLLPDGQLARFYELQTNRPLYFTKDYQLTYSDADMPTHYAFKVGNWTDSAEREYQRLVKLTPEQVQQKDASGPAKASPKLISEVKSVLAAMDDRGRWVEDGGLQYQGDDDRTRRIIDCSTFIRNVRTLSAYLATQGE